MLSCLDTGDRIRLGDTSLIVEVERPRSMATNVFWWWQDTPGWTGSSTWCYTAADGALDLVITNVGVNGSSARNCETDIGIIGSDSQGMGRIGEVICRTWQLASKMKDRGASSSRNDNSRAALLSKYTINVARTYGIDLRGFARTGESGYCAGSRVSSVKPELIIKGGFIAWAPMANRMLL